MKTWKKLSAAGILLLALGIFSCEETNGPGSSFTVTVDGRVTNLSGLGLDSVYVTLTDQVNSIFARDTVDAVGVYNLTFTASGTDEAAATIAFSRFDFLQDFYDTSTTIVYSSTKRTINVPDVAMTSPDSAINNQGPGRPSARAGTIAFAGSASPFISIRGAGGTEATNLTFEARDSIGNTVDERNALMVHFNFVSRPDTLAELSIDSVRTNSSGKAVVQLTGGLKAGLAQIQASAVVKNPVDTTKQDTIKSSVISIPIYGGLPDSLHFTIGPDRFNVPGGVVFNERVAISVLVGDKWGNPTQPGIPIYFTTTGGIIQGSSVTSVDGQMSVELITGAPFPPNGLAVVTAEIPIDADAMIKGGKKIGSKVLSKYLKTNKKSKGSDAVNLAMSTITRSTAVLFSGPTRLAINPSDLIMPPQTNRIVNFTVSDPLGNPLSGGTSVKVTGAGFDDSLVTLTGDVDVQIPDTYDPSWTQFAVLISDNRPDNLAQQTRIIGLTIEVSSPNGNVKRTLGGYIDIGVPVPPLPGSDTTDTSTPAREPAQIAFRGASSSDIFVAGVGGLETSTIVYEVRDSLGVAIDLKRRVGATFSLIWYPNTFAGGGTPPTNIPIADSSDAQGLLRTTIVSGTQAGVVQLIATVVLPSSKVITSQPIKVSVHAGFPDPNHFTLVAPYYNFPGLDRAFVNHSVTVQIADKYSNPIIAGTAVYFNSAHGTMVTGGGGTDDRGFIESSFNSANPFPEGADTLQPDAEMLNYYPSVEGFSRIYARTLGKDGQPILDSLLFLWTGKPRFTNTGPSSFAVANGGSAGPFTFTIVDRLGHPMSSGTSITVTADAGKLGGNVSRTIPDTFLGGPGITTFSVSISDNESTDTEPPAPTEIVVTVNHPVYGKYEYTLASGTVD